MTPNEIEAQLATLFPTEGLEENLTQEDSRVQELFHAIHDQWEVLPKIVQERIDRIADNMCGRGIPFALRLLRWMEDDD